MLIVCYSLSQGLPNMGSNAGAGTLDFLRNSQQVKRCFSELGFYWYWEVGQLDVYFWSDSNIIKNIISFKPYEPWCKRILKFCRYLQLSSYASDVDIDCDLVTASCLYLQPMLQELGKQNPQLVRLIQEHQADFLRLINEPVEGEG